MAWRSIPKNTFPSKMAEIKIYTDGAASGNPGPGGYGVVLLAGPHRKELAEGFRKTTNNRMELLAVIVALESLKGDGHEVTVYSDSKDVVDAVKQDWLINWQKRGWKKADKTPVKNQDLWKRFLKIYKKNKVDFQWVKGHANIPENERCDRLAVHASKQENLPPDLGFENQEVDPAGLF